MKRKYRHLVEWATVCKDTVLYPLSMGKSELGNRAKGLSDTLVDVLAEVNKIRIKKPSSELRGLLSAVIGAELSVDDARVSVALSKGMFLSKELDSKIRALAKEVEEAMLLYHGDFMIERGPYRSSKEGNE